MTIAWGSTLSKTHFDADTDDPSQARAELEAMVDRINTKLANQTLLQLSDKTGNDAGIVSGTAGTDGNLVQWNADGDVVDGPDVLSAISSGASTDVVSKGAIQGAGVAALVPLLQATSSGDATVEFTSNIDDTYDVYVVHMNHVAPASDNVNLIARTSTDAGANWDNGASDYKYASSGRNAAGTEVVLSGNGSDGLTLIDTAGNAAGESIEGWIMLRNPSDTSKTTLLQWQFVSEDATGGFRFVTGGGLRNATEDVTGLRFLFSSGNIGVGDFRLYGVKKS